MIEHYSFGRIVIDGKEYNKDIIITTQGVIPNWWRREGHRLSIEDLEGRIDFNLDVLIIGTGYYGVMKVPEEVIEELRKRGIKEVIVKPTKEACKIFNEFLKKGVEVVAALHLTC